MTRFVNFLWPPFVNERPEEERIREEELKTDIDKIKRANWENHKLALDEARNLTTIEGERKRSAENKASIYLAAIAVIVPILSSLGVDFYGKNFVDLPTMSQTIILILFLLGISYLVMSGLWAFKTLAVSVHHRIDVDEIVALGNQKDAEVLLIRDHLLAVRLNRHRVNQKTGFIRMAHEFLIRAFFSFAILIVTMTLDKPATLTMQFLMDQNAPII